MPLLEASLSPIHPHLPLPFLKESHSQARLTMSHRPSQYIAPRQLLNNDILLFVLSLSSFQTATSMMATCYFLYHEGAKSILHDSPMTFDADMSEDNALALLRFIQAEDLSRCPHVCKLHVLMNSISDIVAESLIDLVPRMTSLKTLLVTIERALKSHPDLVPAFGSLRSIETLLVVNAGQCSCELVRALQSQLVAAEIYFDTAGQRPLLSSNPDFHPLIMLQKSPPTLKTLLSGFLVDNKFELMIILRPPDVTYPNMHTFVLHECPPIILSPYIKLFPNLAHLCVKYHSPSPWEDGQPNLLSSILPQVQRVMNLELPVLAPSGVSLAWTNLQEYTRPLMDLWALGLTCPITRLTLEDVPATRSAPLALTDVLAYARPTELAITFRKCSLTDVLETDFLSALHTKGASGLRSLMFVVWLHAGDCDLDVARALDDIVATVSCLNLTHLDIGTNNGGLDGEEAPSPSDEPGLPGPPPSEATGAAAPHFDAHTPTHTPMPDTAPSDHEDTPPPNAHASVPDSNFSNSDSDSDSDSESLSLSLGERTLDAVDVLALAERFLDTIPTLEDSLIAIQWPRRGGATLWTFVVLLLVQSRLSLLAYVFEL
ncbi:hypothetical protein LXA43DRAFT_1104473 [Ganoderma leucocontextum]|nr:hypothetical protein LXA43DRAFT_1104473 [Ganoderma leucocontextum]